MSESNIDDEGFTTINRKKRKDKSSIKPVVLTRDLIIKNEELKLIFNKYEPFSVLLYGSYSRNNPGTNSDINLVIIWNYKYKAQIKNAVENIKSDAFNIFNKKIEILPMILKKNNCFGSDNYFISNIFADAISIYGNQTIDNIYNSAIYNE